MITNPSFAPEHIRCWNPTSKTKPSYAMTIVGCEVSWSHGAGPATGGYLGCLTWLLLAGQLRLPTTEIRWFWSRPIVSFSWSFRATAWNHTAGLGLLLTDLSNAVSNCKWKSIQAPSCYWWGYPRGRIRFTTVVTIHQRRYSNKFLMYRAHLRRRRDCYLIVCSSMRRSVWKKMSNGYWMFRTNR